MDENQIEKIDLDRVDWRGSREFFESLGEALDKLDSKDESYDFTWVGKRKAIIEAGAPINKIFRPDVENSKNWDTTENLFIEGDNLDALKLLQESYLGKVKMIYIDPPYNTGKDFVYHDDFRADVEDYDEATEYKNESGNIQFKKNEKSNGRYHSDWLSMMYPRLKLARNLLAEDGIVLISIDDNEQANLKKLCDEIFGEDNFAANIIWRGGRRNAAKNISTSHEYMLMYVRDIGYINSHNISWKEKKQGLRQIYKASQKILTITGDDYDLASEELKKWYSRLPDNDPARDHKHYSRIDAKGVYFCSDISRGGGGGPKWLVINPKTGKEVQIPSRGWSYSSKDLMQKEIEADKIYFPMNNGVPTKKIYLHENETQLPETVLYRDRRGSSKRLRELLGGDLFDFPKDEVVLAEKIASFTDGNGVILDFFSGSGTTAHAVMLQNAKDLGNRKWIMVQLPETTDEKSEAFRAGYKTIPEIARERIRRAGDKIKSEHPEAKVDYGFRALRIADTNYKEVYKPTGQFEQSMLLDVVENIKEDRSDLDLLFGVLTQSALELNRPIEKRDIDGSDVYLYDYFGEVSGLVACFSKNISEETIKQIAALKPFTAVFRESSFSDSQAKVNLSEHFRILSPDTKVKVI